MSAKSNTNRCGQSSKRNASGRFDTERCRSGKLNSNLLFAKITQAKKPKAFSSKNFFQSSASAILKSSTHSHDNIEAPDQRSSLGPTANPSFKQRTDPLAGQPKPQTSSQTNLNKSSQRDVKALRKTVTVNENNKVYRKKGETDKLLMQSLKDLQRPSSRIRSIFTPQVARAEDHSRFAHPQHPRAHNNHSQEISRPRPAADLYAKLRFNRLQSHKEIDITHSKNLSRDASKQLSEALADRVYLDTHNDNLRRYEPSERLSHKSSTPLPGFSKSICLNSRRKKNAETGSNSKVNLYADMRITQSTVLSNKSKPTNPLAKTLFNSRKKS